MKTPRPTHWTSAAKLVLVLVLGVILITATAEADAQAPAPAAAGDSARGDATDQARVVSTSGGTFWNSVGYMLVTLLVGGSLYAVCRSSHRT